jgi:hypothetical protein
MNTLLKAIYSFVILSVSVILDSIQDPVRFLPGFRVRHGMTVMKHLKKGLIFALVFQFLTIPLYPVLQVAQVYAQPVRDQYYKDEAPAPNLDPNPEAYVAPPQYNEPPAPVYYQPPAPRYQAPPPVYYEPDPEPVYEDPPAAETEPSVQQEPVQQAPKTAYQACLDEHPYDEYCDRVFFGSAAPITEEPQPGQETASGSEPNESTSWWETPLEWGAEAWEWIADTAEETGRTVAEVVKDSGEYIASRFGGDESQPDSAQEPASTAQAPQPQDPQWQTKIAQAQSDWDIYKTQAQQEDPEAAAQTRAKTVLALGLSDAATDAEVDKALGASLGANVSGPPADLTVSLGLPEACEISVGCIPKVSGGGIPDIPAAIDSVPGPLAFVGRLVDGFLFGGYAGTGVDITQAVSADSKLNDLGIQMGIFPALDKAGVDYKSSITGRPDYELAYQEYLRLFPEAQNQLTPFSEAIADFEGKKQQAQSSALSVVTVGTSDLAAGGLQSGNDWKEVANHMDTLVFNRPEVWNALKEDPLIYDEQGNIDSTALAMAARSYYQIHGTEADKRLAQTAVDKANEAEVGYQVNTVMAAPLGVAVMLAGPEIAVGGAGAFIADLYLPAVGGGAIRKLFVPPKSAKQLKSRVL